MSMSAKELYSDYNQMKYGKIKDLEKEALKHPERKEYYDKRIADLKAKLLELHFGEIAAYDEEAIQEIKKENRDKRFKKSTKQHEKSEAQCHKNINTINDIMNNPLVDESENRALMKETQSIRVLREFINNIKIENKDKLDPEVAELFKIVENVINEYRKIMRSIDQKLSSDFNDVKVSTKSTTILAELEDLRKSLLTVESNIRKDNYNSDMNEVYKKAKEESKDIKKAKHLEDDIEKMPANSDINKAVLRESISTINVIEIIDKLNKLLTAISVQIPPSNIYGSVRIDFSSLHEEIKKAERLLNSKKDLNERKLEEKGFNKEMDKIKAKENKERTVYALAHLYERLNSTFGNERKEIENEIENLLINSGIPQNEWDITKIDAQKISDAKKADKEFERQSKFKTKEAKENRDIAIANREGVSREEIERIEREVRAEAARRFPTNDALKGGEVHDLNSKAREEFIRTEIDHRLSSLSAYKVDVKESEKRSNELIDLQNSEEIAREGISNEMLNVATEILNIQEKLQEADISKLKPEELRQAIDTARKLKTYAGLKGMDLARQMVLDTMPDPKAPIDNAKLMYQFNMNNMHNIEGKLKLFFETEEIKR